ncbi:hypothetical protein SLA2020_238730 [Shorea laevis]
MVYLQLAERKLDSDDKADSIGSINCKTDSFSFRGEKLMEPIMEKKELEVGGKLMRKSRGYFQERRCVAISNH